MRKRSVQILFRLNEEEAEYLYELVRKSGRSKEAFLREMVKGYRCFFDYSVFRNRFGRVEHWVVRISCSISFSALCYFWYLFWNLMQ